MTTPAKFWTGYRAADLQKALDLDTPEAADLRVGVRAYYRLFNDGDIPSASRFQRLCRVTGLTFINYSRDVADVQDTLLEALLDRALA